MKSNINFRERIQAYSITVTETITETDTVTVETDSALPIGALAVSRQSTLTAESGTPTAGATVGRFFSR